MEDKITLIAKGILSELIHSIGLLKKDVFRTKVIAIHQCEFEHTTRGGGALRKCPACPP
jgi:hypothetical protein